MILDIISNLNKPFQSFYHYIITYIIFEEFNILKLVLHGKIACPLQKIAATRQHSGSNHHMTPLKKHITTVHKKITMTLTLTIYVHLNIYIIIYIYIYINICKDI